MGGGGWRRGGGAHLDLGFGEAGERGEGLLQLEVGVVREREGALQVAELGLAEGGAFPSPRRPRAHASQGTLGTWRSEEREEGPS